MKTTVKIFIFWIAAQMMVIGVVGFNIVNDFSRGRLECAPKSTTSRFTATINGLLFPLVMFTPDNLPEIDAYCANK